ncbi:MAG: hypothetical protein HGA27_07515 [Peptococcaceae bacterium]|nr:hypothetical protein [Peptococcaceae bacterium]
MTCSRCKEKITEDDDVFDFYGETLCEDCYIGTIQPPRSCDPAAVSSARFTREILGHSGSDGLTPEQKKIYEIIKEKGQITKEVLAQELNLPKWELEKQFAVLRHCELIKAKKEDQTIYLTIM